MLADRMRQAATVKTAPPGQQAYTTAGTYTFTVPAGVTSVSVVCVGGGQGGPGGVSGSWTGGQGASLSYKNNITVSSGENCTVVVGDKSNGTYNANASAGGDSYFLLANASIEVRAKGGGSSSTNIGTSNTGGLGNYGLGISTAGGGAGGYSGSGGSGGDSASPGSAGSGGGGGGGGGGGAEEYPSGSNNFYYGNGGGGGGVGILGSGSNGAGGAVGTGYFSNGSAGGGGSSGSSGSGTAGGAYGGGGGTGGGYWLDGGSPEYFAGGNGAVGAVRIIWGAGRSYPSNAANV